MLWETKKYQDSFFHKMICFENVFKTPRKIKLKTEQKLLKLPKKSLLFFFVFDLSWQQLLIFVASSSLGGLIVSISTCTRISHLVKIYLQCFFNSFFGLKTKNKPSEYKQKKWETFFWEKLTPNFSDKKKCKKISFFEII